MLRTTAPFATLRLARSLTAAAGVAAALMLSACDQSSPASGGAASTTGPNAASTADPAATAGSSSNTAPGDANTPTTTPQAPVAADVTPPLAPEVAAVVGEWTLTNVSGTTAPAQRFVGKWRLDKPYIQQVMSDRIARPEATAEQKQNGQQLIMMLGMFDFTLDVTADGTAAMSADTGGTTQTHRGTWTIAQELTPTGEAFDEARLDLEGQRVSLRPGPEGRSLLVPSGAGPLGQFLFMALEGGTSMDVLGLGLPTTGTLTLREDKSATLTLDAKVYPPSELIGSWSLATGGGYQLALVSGTKVASYTATLTDAGLVLTAGASGIPGETTIATGVSLTFGR